jgi:hypothetical protein
LTGAINVAIQSIHTRDSVAFAVLVGYTVVLSVVAWGLRGVRVKL